MEKSVIKRNISYSTGVVRVTSAFDYETTQTYDILIEVADQGTDPAAMSTTVLVTAVVTDINEAYSCVSIYKQPPINIMR